MRKKRKTWQKKAKKAGKIVKKSNSTSLDFISPYLINSNDLTQMSSYPVSKMASDYYREHSNINQILDRIVKKQKIEECNKEDYLVTLIRHVTSDSQIRQDYPFNMFKFKSDYHECIGKFLLKNYEIKSNKDLEEANAYLSAKKIKSCQISMGISNKFHADKQKYINTKIRHVGYQNLKPYLQLGIDHAMRQYNYEHKTFKSYNINDITLEEMCQISTIERVARNEIVKREYPESLYNVCLKSLFTALKINRSLAINQQDFYVYPQYLLIINNLTIEQERAVTIEIELFFKCTNALDILDMEKENIPTNNQNEDPLTNSEERKKNFYLKFIRMIDKKMPPFHNLLWNKNHILSKSDNQQLAECEAGPSNESVWKRKILFKNNKTAQPPKQNSSINRDIDMEDKVVIPENTVIQHRLARNPKDYYSAQISGSRFGEFILFLMKENKFIEELKNEIVKDKICAKLWERNFKLLLWNCMHFNLEERNGHFMQLLIKYVRINREKLNEMLKKVGFDAPVVQNIPSTQNMDIQFDPGLLPINDNHQIINDNHQINDNHHQVDLDVEFVSSNETDIINISDEEDIENIVDINNKPISEDKVPETMEQDVDDLDVEFVSSNETDIINISDEEDNPLKVNRISQFNNVNSNDINASTKKKNGLKIHRFAMQKVINRIKMQLNKPSTLNYESGSSS